MRLPGLRLVEIAVLLIPLALPTGTLIADDSASLRLIVFGATGRVGSRVTQEARARGHQVTAVSRKPEKIKNRDTKT